MTDKAMLIDERDRLAAELEQLKEIKRWLDAFGHEDATVAINKLATEYLAQRAENARRGAALVEIRDAYVEDCHKWLPSCPLFRQILAEMGELSVSEAQAEYYEMVMKERAEADAEAAEEKA